MAGASKLLKREEIVSDKLIEILGDENKTGLGGSKLNFYSKRIRTHKFAFKVSSLCADLLSREWPRWRPA